MLLCSRDDGNDGRMVMVPDLVAGALDRGPTLTVPLGTNSLRIINYHMRRLVGPIEREIGWRDNEHSRPLHPFVHANYPFVHWYTDAGFHEYLDASPRRS